ncbi:MAG: anaerobic ribonucleoside-triphosphate reductase activating protein [Christensenellaceae bacterium]|jgi:pyruvate formate lyase activating enzyme|nr:anaerobic ribonucleoside-triphosphate reductase activating protein [Christensenellaceae bacterium]
MHINVAGTVKNSFVDWPGKIAFVVFLAGCNFNCPHCHNHNILSSMSNRLPWGSVLTDIKEQIGFIDGVVISGGEPTQHPHLDQIIRDIRALGLPVKLDTNGSDFDTLRRLVEDGLVSFVAMDIKAPLARYGELGFFKGSIDDVERSIEFLKQAKVDFMFRTTPIPELTEQDFMGIKKLVGDATWVKNNFVPQKP